MSKEFYQHKDYPKISKDYTVDDIKKFLSTIEFTFNDEFKCLDDIMSNVITHNNYCEYSKISVDSFEFFWKLSSFETILTHLATANYSNVVDNEIKFPVVDKINAIASSLNVLNDPYDDYEETFYFDKNGLLKIARVLRLTDPCDEDDDGVDIILYEGMDETLYDDIIDEFFNRAYIRYMADLPDELRKPITKMTPDEYKVFLMYVI